MEKMLKYRYNRMRYVLKELLKGNITEEQFQDEIETLKNEISLLEHINNDGDYSKLHSSTK
jgi:hypothetical protein